jgi:hypothetical protein
VRSNGARPYEGHLLLAVQRQRLQVNLAHQLAELARETDLPMPSRGATAGGDRDRLRGIPVQGFGGAMRRTRPESDSALDRLDREIRALVILAQDVPGTSPGSDPVDVLFGH